MAKRVFPLPGPPHTSVDRLLGKPPSVISSNPAIPVGDLRSVKLPEFTCSVIGFHLIVLTNNENDPKLICHIFPYKGSVFHHIENYYGEYSEAESKLTNIWSISAIGQ